jgi:hypothetical protein
MALCVFGYGCGSATGTSQSNPTSPPTLTGNWQLTVSSQIAPGVTLLLGAYLVSNNGSVSGETVLDGALTMPPCSNLISRLSFGSGLPLEGTLSDGQLLLGVNSASPSGIFFLSEVGVVSITAKLTSSARGTTLSGTYSLAANSGSGCGSDSGTVTGVLVPSLAGQWSGNLTSNMSRAQFQVALNLTEGATDSFGFPSLNGSATFSGSQCFTSGTVTADQVGPTMGGPGLGQSNDVGSAFIATNGGGILIASSSSGFTENSTGTALPFYYSVTSGSCLGEQGSGTLSRQ